ALRRGETRAAGFAPPASNASAAPASAAPAWGSGVPMPGRAVAEGARKRRARGLPRWARAHQSCLSQLRPTPQISERVAARERVGGIHDVLREPGDPGLPPD